MKLGRKPSVAAEAVVAAATDAVVEGVNLSPQVVQEIGSLVLGRFLTARGRYPKLGLPRKLSPAQTTHL